jgi:predicted transcriptional regulator
MDKILSTRVDEAIIKQIGLLAQKLATTKKAIIENAVRDYFKKVETDQDVDILEKTFGAWQRTETPEETVRQIRNEFRKSMERHKQ